VRAVLGVLLGLVARVWLATLRVRVVADAALAARAGSPWVLAFFHGTQWPLLAWRRRGATVVLVSFSGDGAMQAKALALQGLTVVRGSSSRGGARGLASLVRAMRARRADAAFAVDGPRGPYGVAKPGAVLAAKKAGAWLVPMGSASARGVVLSRAWDRFVLAWPFSRVSVVLGAPIDPAVHGAREALEEAIARANAAAVQELAA
jgi:lysophospholipid acyltransferase (LPLAT)-like uncharacterized protein